MRCNHFSTFFPWNVSVSELFCTFFPTTTKLCNLLNFCVIFSIPQQIFVLWLIFGFWLFAAIIRCWSISTWIRIANTVLGCIIHTVFTWYAKSSCWCFENQIFQKFYLNIWVRVLMETFQRFHQINVISVIFLLCIERWSESIVILKICLISRFYPKYLSS